MVDEIIWLLKEILREQNFQRKGEKDSMVYTLWEGGCGETSSSV
jgi:hypothetical protein